MLKSIAKARSLLFYTQRLRLFGQEQKTSQNVQVILCTFKQRLRLALHLLITK
jgi:hypothetical protein